MRNLALVISFFLFSLNVFSADYYWVGGSGDWSDINHWATASGGAIHHIQTPTATDNVILDSNSFSSASVINLNISTIFCKSFDAEQISESVSMSGICSIWKVYGSFKLSKKISLANFDIFFEAQNGVNNLKFKNLNLVNSIFFKGLGTWVLLDSMHCRNISLESGTFNANSQTVSFANFKSNVTVTRELNIVNSILIGYNWEVNGAGYIVNAANSIITLNGSRFRHLSSGNLSYNDLYLNNYCSITNSQQNITFRKVQFYSSGNISGNNIYDSLVFTRGMDYLIAANTTQTIINDLVAIGDCKRKIRIEGVSSFADFYKASGTIYCSYLELKHIHATGGGSFQAAATDDLGDNNGWIMTPPPTRTLFWVGGTGNWNDTIHWSYNSGGIGGECIPTIVDDVIIDSNSYTMPFVITMNNYAFCHDFLWKTEAVGTFDIPFTLSVSGSMFLGKDLTLTPAANIDFVSDDNGEIFTTSNIDLNMANIKFNGSGSWTLQDSIKNSGGGFFLISGYLLTNDQYIITNKFGAITTGFKKLSLSSSLIEVEKSAAFQQDSLYIYPGASHIKMIGGDTKFETKGINPDSLYNLTFDTDTGSAISNINKTVFNKVTYLCDMSLSGISISDTVYFKEGRSFVFTSRTDTIKKALFANGNCTKVITMRELTAMGEFIIYMPSSANVSVSNLSLRGSKVIGGATFNAINSSDLSNNTGWTFTNVANNHYWVNGNGNWQDSTHWSYSSGGVGGACIPKIYDNVYFDGNSFLASNDTVVVDTNNIFCKDMSWIGATGNPVFSFDSSNYVHYISGSITLIEDMDFENKNETFFVWNQLNKTIDMSGQEFNANIIFADSGQWTLIDTLTVKGNIFHYIGSLISNQKPIFAESYLGELDKVKTLDINNSSFNIRAGGVAQVFSWRKSPQTNIITSNSQIIFDIGGILKTSGSGQVVFNDVSFVDSVSIGIIRHSTNVTNRFNKLLFLGDGNIEADNYMDTLVFSRSRAYTLEGGMHQYITNRWDASSDCYGFITVRGGHLSSASLSNIANVHMLNGNVNLQAVKLQNINGIGNGSFNIINGFDLGGNSSNWQISTYPARTLFWVNNSGSWWDTAHWSLNSGGLAGECIPTYIDDVYFTSASFISTSDTASSLNTPIECHSMYWNYTPDTPFLNIQNLNIYGSLWLGDTLTIHPNTILKFYALDTANIIRTANKTISNTFFQSSGKWMLYDDLNSKIIYHNKGRLKGDGNSIYSRQYVSTSSQSNPQFRELDISNSILNVEYKVDILTDSFNLIAANSDINFAQPLSSNPTFKLLLSGDNVLNFGRVTFIPAMTGFSKIQNSSSSIHNFEKMTINNSADIYGQFSFDSLIFHAGNTYQLEASKTQFIGDYWFVRGNNCFALTLQSTLKGSQAYTSKLLGNVNGDFINMRDINATGGASFFAGDFSTDISNNYGWTFSNGPQYVYGLGPNVSLNLGASVTLSSANFNGGPNTTYLWSTGSTAPNITVNQTGWYYITVNYAGACIVYDSIWVGCNLNMNYNITDNPCYGDSAGVIFPIVPDSNYLYSYQWSNNSSSAIADSLVAGVYTVTISADSGFCVLYDTLEVTQPPQIFCNQGDTAVCTGDSVRLDLGSFSDFYWDDNYSGQYRWVLHKDSFIVRIEDSNGCLSLPDTINIREDKPPIIQLADDTTICLGGSVTLNIGENFDSYLWSNNSVMSTITVQNTGTYWVIVSEKTCRASDTIIIHNCPPKFIVPNVFTPNGDGFNDNFEIEYQNIFEFEIRIYNRWGTRVFKSSNIEEPWNGKINGQDAKEGVYFWEIIYQEYNGMGGGSDKKVQGSVTLLRN